MVAAIHKFLILMNSHWLIFFFMAYTLYIAAIKVYGLRRQPDRIKDSPLPHMLLKVKCDLLI